MKKIKYLLSTALASAILFGMAGFQVGDIGKPMMIKVE